MSAHYPARTNFLGVLAKLSFYAGNRPEVHAPLVCVEPV
jgi:hypothetical protein